MTNEEVERAIGFLLESQARHDAQIGELREMVAETNRAVQMMAASQSEVNEMLTRAVTNLAEAQQQTDARLRETDARLNALIGVVERLASGEGGKPGA